MRWPLRYQIMIPMAAAMLAAIVGLSVLNAYIAGRRITSRIKRQVAEVTRTLAESNFPLTKRVLKQMEGLAGAHFVLVDEQGHATASNDDIDVLHLPSSDTEEDAKDLEFFETVQVGERQYYHVLLALPQRSTVAGRQKLHVLYPEHAYRDAWQQAVQPPLVIGGVSLAIVALIGVGIASRVSRPMDCLREQFGRIAEGHFSLVPLPRRNDEVRDLAIAVNRMAKMLAKYEQEVRRTEQFRTLGHLVSGLAHQLRNSATGAQMALDIHREECPQGRDSESLGVAARQLVLIEKYLRKFLSLDARSHQVYTEVDFSDLVASLVPLIRPTAKHVGVRLDILLPDKPLLIEGDKDALEHVVLNLLLNAIEAAERVSGLPAETGAIVCVEVSRVETDRLRLTVEDTGAGPAADIAAKLFEPFVTDKSHGTGLGLSLAKDITEAHHGSICWERRQDRTVFTVELPLILGKVHRVKTARR
ncbi:MAG: ATP-binding protein [Pirellulaceae bacterium]